MSSRQVYLICIHLMRQKEWWRGVSHVFHNSKPNLMHAAWSHETRRRAGGTHRAIASMYSITTGAVSRKNTVTIASNTDA